MAVLIAGLIIATPALIEALPDRYVLRLPEPLQKYGLPQSENSFLPTAVAPNAAQSLLSPTIESTRQTTAPLDNPATLPVNSPSGSDASGPAEEVSTSVIAPLETPAAPATAAATPTPLPNPTATPMPLPTQVRLEGFRHRFQTWNNCGPATLAMALTYFGKEVYQEETALILKPDPEDRNVSPHEMADYVNDQTPYRALFRANGTVETLRKLLAHDMPVIIETGINPPGEFRWLGWYGHYLLLVAYDDDAEQFWVYDSWFGTSEEPLQNAHPDGRIISYEALASDWSNFNRNFIVLYTPEQASLLEELIGQDMDDDVMWQLALERTKQDTENEPENPFNWFNLGTNYVALQQYEEAAVAFDQARSIGLPWRMLWYQFGPYEAYLNTGRFEDVVLLADTTLKDRPYFEESYYYKGLALEGLGNINAAQQNLEQAARFNPNFAPAREALDRLK